MRAANSTAAETTRVPEPDGQQDLDARAVEGWQEKGHPLIPSPYSYISFFLYFTFFQVLRVCAMFYSLQTVLIAREDVGFALAFSAKDSL